ncbi:MAG: alpha/beta fold hydrolase [Melioribacteraceae bacterium]|jgi:phospholipase/carboxylesterase|nr:alpha/beta fold hydrolase [Melioribacteraceae bacterium]
MMNLTNIIAPHNAHPFVYSGTTLEHAKAVMIMIHGRGSTAQNILSLVDELNVDGIVYIAPQASDYSWYPYSFLSPVKMNEPGRSSGLSVIDSIANQLSEYGFTSDKIFLLGFSQGACLSLEYAARFPKKVAAVFGLSGGLIGDRSELINYYGDLQGTEIFLGCSDIDPHIPLQRINETEQIFLSLNAKVEKRIYNGMGHTVNNDEIDFIRCALSKS